MEYSDEIDTFNDIYYNIDKINDLNNELLINCEYCNQKYNTTYQKFLFGDHCGICIKKIIKNKDINKIKELSFNNHFNNINILNTDEITGIHARVSLHCNKCNKTFKQSIFKHLKGYTCPICKESHGEKIIRYFLIRNNLLFETNKKFDNCKNIKNLSYDFFIPKYNLLVEYDGKQHFYSIDKWGGDKRLKKQVENDNKKNEYAQKNGFNIIRISKYHTKTHITIYDFFKKIIDIKNGE